MVRNMKGKTILALVLVLMMGVQGLGAALATGVDPNAEKPVLRWLGNYASYDPNAEYVAQLLEERTGYSVEYNVLPSENADQKLSLELSAGTHYDVLKLNANQFAMLMGQGALLPLNEYLDAEPSIKELVDPKTWGFVTDNDGQIYGIPEGAIIQMGSALGYRYDIFEEYGFTVPNTPDELYELLKEIKEKTGLIPLTGNQPLLQAVASGFGLDNYTFYLNDEGQPTAMIHHPGVKPYLEFMNKLYAEELIDIDWPVNKSENINQKMSSGQAVMAQMSWSTTPSWTNGLVSAGVENAEFRSIMPLEEENGFRHLNPNGTSSIQNIICIPRKSAQNAAFVVDMVAKRLEQETWWAYNAGEEGVHFEFVDGVPTPIQPKFADDLTNASFFQTSVNYTQHPITWQARVARDPMLYAAWHDMNSQSMQYEMTYNPFSYGSFPEFNQYNASLLQKVNDYYLKVIVGSESVDGLDAFIASWEASGGTELEEGARRWFAENPETVKAALNTVPSFYDKFKAE